MADIDKERVKSVARDAGHFSGQLGNWILSALLSPLPKAWRAALEARTGLDGDAAAVPGSFLQFGAGACVWCVGFLGFMQAQLKQGDALAMGAMMMNPIQPIVYSLISPVGLPATFVWFGGFVRLMGLALNREPLPDPWLALVEWLRCLGSASARRRLRELEKGEATPDVITLGAPRSGFDLRLVSRHDHDWNDTVTIAIAGEHYRLLRKQQIQDEQGRLRTSYELHRITGAEVFRGMRKYQPAEAPVIVRDGN